MFFTYLNLLLLKQHPISIEVFQFLNFKRAKDKHPYQTTFVMYHHFAVLRVFPTIICYMQSDWSQNSVFFFFFFLGGGEGLGVTRGGKARGFFLNMTLVKNYITDDKFLIYVLLYDKRLSHILPIN